jgi:hypothetical protein
MFKLYSYYVYTCKRFAYGYAYMVTKYTKLHLVSRNDMAKVKLNLYSNLLQEYRISHMICSLIQFLTSSLIQPETVATP